jgi:hypothetical protein
MGLHDTLSEFAEQIDEHPDGDPPRSRRPRDRRSGDDATDRADDPDARARPADPEPAPAPAPDRDPAPDSGTERERTGGAPPATDSGRPASDRDAAAWTTVEVPTDKSLYGVVRTARGALAVGEEGLVLLRGDDGWTVVVADGPAAEYNPLTDVAVSADRERVWFCGGSGALGCYDVVDSRKYDFSAHEEKTSTWEAIAITGERGDERLRVANGSGEVLAASVGAQLCPTVESLTEPGCGSTITSLAFDGGTCFAVDTSGAVTEETGDGWTEIGIDDAEVNFSAVCAAGADVYVAGDDGLVYRYDRPCRNWTPTRIAPNALCDVARDGDRLVAVGNGGTVRERRPGQGWTEASGPTGSERPTETILNGVALVEVDTAVGAEGTVIER